MSCEYCGQRQPKGWNGGVCVYCSAVLPNPLSEMVFIGTLYGVNLYCKETDKFRAITAIERISNMSIYTDYGKVLR